MDVGSLRQRRLLVAGERDDPGALTLEVRHQQREFVGLTRIGQHHDHVVGRDHAQVAVRGFRRVDEEGGCSRGRERGGELARDVARLADAGDDDATAAVEDQRDGGNERRVEARRNGGDRARLGGEHVAGQCERACRVDAGSGDGLGQGGAHAAQYNRGSPRFRVSAAAKSPAKPSHLPC